MTGHTPPPERRPDPALRLLSLGAGIQSTAVLLLACDGAIPQSQVLVKAFWVTGCYLLLREVLRRAVSRQRQLTRRP